MNIEISDFGSALSDLNIAIQKGGDFNRTHALIRKAFCLGKLGNHKESLSLFEKIDSESEGVPPEHYYYWGLILIENDNLVKGCELLNKARQSGFDIKDTAANCDK